MISIVSPIFNEEDTLPEFYKRLSAALQEYGDQYEIILVNDGSRDNSLNMMREINANDPRVKIVNLSRNFGHQIAICAGLDQASGNVIAIMDSDLQDPPEVLPKFFEKQKEGYDIVYAVRKNRKEGILKKTAYAVFYRLLIRMVNINIPLDSGDFCVISRRALDVLKTMPERNPFLRGLRGWIGFNQIGLEYDRDKRFAGEVKYTFSKLTKLAFDGFISFSYVPLRLASVMGLMISAISFLSILIIFYLSFFTSRTTAVPGWASITTIILFLGGVQLVTIGIIGEYIGRIYDEVKQRPLYIVQDVIGYEPQKIA